MLALDIAKGMIPYEIESFDCSKEIARLLDLHLIENERLFEEQIVFEFPYEVIFPYSNDYDELEIQITAVDNYLLRFPKESYIAFPNAAIGRYKRCGVCSVFFKNASYALQTKLAFLV